jgi:CCR4-NOT transcription complex subunit 6
MLISMQAEQFSYCQSWQLAWGYRKQNLLKELLNYNADIMCLQACPHTSSYPFSPSGIKLCVP